MNDVSGKSHCKASCALHGSVGPLKESANCGQAHLVYTVLNLVGGTQNLFEESEGSKQTWGKKRIKILQKINYLNDRDKW